MQYYILLVDDGDDRNFTISFGSYKRSECTFEANCMVDSGFYTKKQFRIIGCQEDQKSIDAAVKRINQEKVDEGAVPRCSQI